MKAHRVAISGWRYFVETFFRESAPDIGTWKRNVLRSDNAIALLASIFALVRADVWYTVGSVENGRTFEFFARLLRKPRVMHWVGSDIEYVRDNPRALQRVRAATVKHVAEATWTVAELRGLGLESSIAPLPPGRTAASMPPLPETFTVLLYVPATRGAFYGAKSYERLIEAFADEPVRFLVVGGGTLDTASPQVKNLGWVDDLGPVYAQATVLLRLTEHDGLSCMVLEALSFGRWVLWPHDFPFVTNANDCSDAEAALRSLLELHRSGNLGLQAGAHAHVRECFDRMRCLERIASYWHAALPASQEVAEHVVA